LSAALRISALSSPHFGMNDWSLVEFLVLAVFFHVFCSSETEWNEFLVASPLFDCVAYARAVWKVAFIAFDGRPGWN
jgi:hypothetical protein